jgi:hypothetical protein
MGQLACNVNKLYLRSNAVLAQASFDYMIDFRQVNPSAADHAVFLVLLRRSCLGISLGLLLWERRNIDTTGHHSS